ncbi:MAG: hypothetical protein F7B17_04700 [Desulfurococcales archaeon]|nr:hypothetical protein [Desulfurococcales archaeon]
MREFYERWPDSLRKGYEGASHLSHLAEDVDYIVVCGMGGSAAVGDFASMMARLWGGPPVTVIKDFSPPFTPSKRTLLLGISYSGDTLETLTCVANLAGHAYSVVTMSSGGRLSRISSSRGWAHIKIPEGIPPRAAFAYMVGALIGVVGSRLGLKDNDVALAAKELEGGEDVAARIVSHLKGNELVVVDTCTLTEALGVRAKSEFSENGKVHVKLQVYPESAHNDIVSFMGRLNPPVLVFKPSREPCKTVMDVVLKVYKSYGIKALELSVDLESPFSTLSNSMKLLKAIGLASIALAEARGLDPSDTKIIKDYKRELKTELEWMLKGL